MEQIEPYGPSWQTEEFEIRWRGEHEKWKAENPDELLDDYEKEKEEKNQVIDPSTVLEVAVDPTPTMEEANDQKLTIAEASDPD